MIVGQKGEKAEKRLGETMNSTRKSQTSVLRDLPRKVRAIRAKVVFLT